MTRFDDHLDSHLLSKASLAEDASVDVQNVDVHLMAIGYTSRDSRLLERIWPLIERAYPQGFTVFHDHVDAESMRRGLPSANQDRERLRQLQFTYLKQLFCAPIDEEYLCNRLRVGQIHHRISLDPQAYLASSNRLLVAITTVLSNSLTESPTLCQQAIAAVSRRLFFDIGIAMNAYVQADRTALQHSNRSLRESEALLNEAHDLAQLARWELRLPGNQLTCCSRAQQLLQLPPGSNIEGYNQLRRWVHPLDRQEVDDAYTATLQTGLPYDVRYRIEQPGLGTRMLRERGRAIIDNYQPVRVVGTMQDISQQVAQLSRIEKLAWYDDLTELPNRANFRSQLERHISDARQSEQPFSALFIDLDEFKEINDTLGHNIGDNVLVEVARRIRSVLRQHEMVARLGGDEFVVLAQGVDAHHAQLIAQRITHAISQPMWQGQTPLAIKASIGISVYPTDGETSDLLLRNADIAMYAAKQVGTGVETYQPAMSERLVRRVEVANRLKRAIDNDDLHLHFQPQIVLANGRLMGAEALVRWSDPVLGDVSPSEFIPLAEQRGMIDRIGHWVMHSACRTLRQWDTQGTPLSGQLAINLSPRQFNDRQFAHRLITQANEAGIPPTRLDLELTESGIMTDPDLSLRILEQLREAGFSLSLDDFGMGYSSLAHLKGFPLDKIKLDRCFVSGMLEQSHDYAIVVATIAMARSLGLDMVAEGVETAEQADALQRLGCSYAQGFHYGRPISEFEFQRHWLQASAEQRITHGLSGARH